MPFLEVILKFGDGLLLILLIAWVFLVLPISRGLGVVTTGGRQLSVAGDHLWNRRGCPAYTWIPEPTAWALGFD